MVVWFQILLKTSDTTYFGRSSAVSVEVFVDTMDAWILFFLGARGVLSYD